MDDETAVSQVEGQVVQAPSALSGKVVPTRQSDVPGPVVEGDFGVMRSEDDDIRALLAASDTEYWRGLAAVAFCISMACLAAAGVLPGRDVGGA